MPCLPDPLIAEYVAELEQPGIPYVSTSHHTLANLYAEHGQAKVQALLNKYWEAKRAAGK